MASETETARVVYGDELRVGDVVDVMWGAGRDMITALKPYTGPLAQLWVPGEARIATFATGPAMTIEPLARFHLLACTSPIAEAA